ncbi:substrate-binding domain-containing protein [Mesorhizobium sp. CA14]|uniref:substrate-binding domain-containing protein n=1 Tax=Mesorhizobium sp. CA14 TaxID=2876642 RepID=UPI001CCD9478|nr:substrate-binding domain-containing protein [Mesorhizobium sp. CA14]MBZ9851330.1 substrate-binding domain-containing protein [Mesorhizobium sp. CA14]
MTDEPEDDRGGNTVSQRLGVREIARRIGVAPITVSRSLSNPGRVSAETRARVLEAIEQIGFVPNQLASSMRGNGRMIGTVVPPLINSGIAEQVQGMSDECHEGGYSMLLVQGEFTREAEEKAIRTLLGWRPAGMILQSFVQSETARSLLKGSSAPVVEISEIKGRDPIDMAVGVSNFETAYAMTMHLAAKGYKRIGFVSTPIHGNDRLQQRRTGYHAALTKLGIKNHGGMEVEVPITAQGGAEALITLTSRRKDIDAIFFSSDTLAIGAIQECHRRGWAVPGRIAIAGYGDMDLAAQLYPRLTTVKVDRYDMGRRAVRQLLTRLGGDGEVPAVTSLGFEIIERESA